MDNENRDAFKAWLKLNAPHLTGRPIEEIGDLAKLGGFNIREVYDLLAEWYINSLHGNSYPSREFFHVQREITYIDETHEKKNLRSQWNALKNYSVDGREFHE